jgi:glycosyltransferase involved in cell wall biosynthesis
MALLMAAFAGVRSVFPAAMLLKVGAAGHSRWRETTLDAARQCGLHLNEHVLLLDSDVDDEFLADIYRASDVFVSTSLYEGFGLPALEAMAVGTPVVVTQCGALPETVGDAGWVVYPEAHHVTDAICEALTNARLRDQRVAAGRRRAASLTWDAAGDAYLEVLRACAARWVRGGTQVGVNA